jgi:DNA-binding HxlR family transcriptional regulator
MTPPETPLPRELKLRFAECPVRASLDVLGHKWALVVLRNVGLYRVRRFNEMLRITPGMTQRILAMRLKELRRAGFLRSRERGRNHKEWVLTRKGRDVLPILMTLVYFGAKWDARKVFMDGKPRPLSDVFERSYIRKILGVVYE